ncbi:MAG: serine/threonine protein kinase, partial [Deltaproteobacteria bacterium]|nr:serine/threonine protein kinase [Deltaproteobacteria bacterium]
MDSLGPGARVGRYRLLERVGAGGMAEVFAARTEGAEGFSRTVAIKVVHADASDEGHLLALIDEARVASVLRHPNVVHVHELDRHGDGLYMVMEFLDGWPLDKLLKRARGKGLQTPVQAVVDLGGQVLDALHYAHHASDHDGTALDLVHRDIKPSNLMLDALGLVKVVDFGIARASNVERRTATGVGKGTPAYMSPEQLYGQPVDPRSDLFALGCVLFELAVGERLFDADAFGPLIFRRQEGFTDADRARLKAACPALAEVISRAVSQDADGRWASAAEMAQALRAVESVAPRSAVRDWLEEVFGADPATESRKISDLGLEGPDARSAAATAAAPFDPTQVAPTAHVDTTAPLAGGTFEEPGATRLVPSPTQSRAMPVALGATALALVAIVLWVRPPGPSDPLAVAPGAAPAIAEPPPAVTVVVAEPTPEPPAEGAPESTPAAVLAEP